MSRRPSNCAGRERVNDGVGVHTFVTAEGVESCAANNSWRRRQVQSTDLESSKRSLAVICALGAEGLKRRRVKHGLQQVKRMTDMMPSAHVETAQPRFASTMTRRNPQTQNMTTFRVLEHADLARVLRSSPPDPNGHPMLGVYRRCIRAPAMTRHARTRRAGDARWGSSSKPLGVWLAASGVPTLPLSSEILRGRLTYPVLFDAEEIS